MAIASSLRHEEAAPYWNALLEAMVGFHQQIMTVQEVRGERSWGCSITG